MNQRFDIGLNSKLTSFSTKFGIDQKNINDNDLFEFFTNYTIISNVLQQDFSDINKIGTGKAKGIDGIGIIVNNQIITDESDLDKIGENENIKIKLCFIQSTIQNSFELKKFQSFTDEVINFLKNVNIIEPFTDIIGKLFNEEERFFEKISETPELELYFSSGKTNHHLENSEINAQKQKIENRDDFSIIFNCKRIYFLQYEELKEYFDKIEKFREVLVTFSNEIQLKEKEKIKISLLSTITFNELKNIILTDDENLRENLFVENVRTKIKDSSVNQDILNTLKNPSDREYFIYLNNGITILCDKIERHATKPNTFHLYYPRIINGCQTCHMLYEYYLQSSQDLNELEIATKVISTEDKSLKKQIIFATNNQNAIDKDLETLNDFHEGLEEYFIGTELFDIYYERLRGQYSDIEPPYKVINKEIVAKAYIAIFKQQPHLMKSRALEKIERFKENGEIFKDKSNDVFKKYYYSAVLYYLLNFFLSNKTIKLKSKTMDMHFLLACDLLLNHKNISTIKQKLEYLKEKGKAESLFKEINGQLENQSYLFERRGFYSSKKTKMLIKYYNNLENHDR